MTTLQDYEADLHKNDDGTKLRVSIVGPDGAALDISSATLKEIKLCKECGTKLTKTAEFETDGSDGVIYYITETGVIDSIGLWTIQGYVEMPSWSGHTSKSTFRVGDIL